MLFAALSIYFFSEYRICVKSIDYDSILLSICFASYAIILESIPPLKKTPVGTSATNCSLTDLLIFSLHKKMMAGMNDMTQAMADIEKASNAYQEAMKNGDEEAANAALSAKSEAESRYKSGQEAVKTGKGMMAAAQNALQTVNLIDFIITNIYNAIKAMQQIIASVSNLMDSMGKDTDSGFMREMNQFSEAMGVMKIGRAHV